MREIGEGSLIKDLERNMYAKVVLFNKDDTIDLRYENEDIQWLTKSKERFKVVSNFRIGDKVKAKNIWMEQINGQEGTVVGYNIESKNPLIKYKYETEYFHNGQGNELFHYESDKNDCWYVNEEKLTLIDKQKFNWEEFKASNKIAVHCKAEEEAIDFCKQMHEHGMEWSNGESYLDETNWNGSGYNEGYKEETCYEADGSYADIEYYGEGNYKILEWSNYMNEEKENSMNLELNNLTEEQKKQIIELAKKFEQENETDKLDFNNDWNVYSTNGKVEETFLKSIRITTDLFRLGLTAHTKEGAEKIRRRLLVEKELRDWAKKCKGKVDWEGNQRKYYVQYEVNTNVVMIDDFINYATANVYFTEREVAKQAIKSIGQERLIRDYFGIDK